MTEFLREHDLFDFVFHNNNIINKNVDIALVREHTGNNNTSMYALKQKQTFYFPIPHFFYQNKPLGLGNIQSSSKVLSHDKKQHSV